jgi:NitT/TauT family transport system substrate-binding protein
MKNYTQRIAKFIQLTIILAASVAGLAFWSCSGKDTLEKPESIIIGTLPYEGSALIYIADDQNFFKKNGLDVTIKNYETGLATTDALNKGEVDVAACAEFIIVGKAFRKEKIRSIATIAKNINEHIIGRSDRGIKTIADLKGKKIGVSRKTVAEFFLGRFLDLHGLSIKEVTLVDLAPSRLGDALIKGDVDAVIAWQPWARQIGERLSNNQVFWEAQSSQLLYWTIVGTEPWLEKHDHMVKKLLISLIQAEKYLISHPGEAKAIVQRRLKYDDAYMADIWPEQQIALSLDQSLILAMEDEARWMIKNGLTAEKQVPDFLNYIYADGLKAEKPEAVNIIR